MTNYDSSETCSRGIWRIIAIVFVIILSIAINLLNADRFATNETCFPESDPIPWNGQNGGCFFASKTPYVKAREELHRSMNGTLPDPGKSCSPVYYYLLTRHSTRYPSHWEIEQFRHVLPKIQKSLLASGTVSPEVAKDLKHWRCLFHKEKAMDITHAGKSHTATLGKFLNQSIISI